MNYSRIYDDLISLAKNKNYGKSEREIRAAGYHEMHHIVPKSMGGDNSMSNRVYLTAREHYIAHWLLYKIHKNKSMSYALFSMTKKGNKSQCRYVSYSHKYAKKAFGRLMSENNSGANHHFFGLPKEKNPNFGSKRDEISRKNMSIAAKRRFESSDNPRCVEITCLETGIKYSSISKAKEDHPIGNIGYALKTGGKAGGHHFFYSNIDIAEIKIKENKYASGGNNANAIKIKNEKTGIIYLSISEAASELNVTGSAISIAIKNSREIKGCKFIYV